MSNLGELVEWTRQALTSSDTIKDSVGALTAPVTASDVTLSVSDLGTVSGAAQGLVEIDFELMRMKSIDAQSSQVVLYPFGRGYRGTTAASHAVDTEVRFNPAFPASRVAREINGVLTEIYPAVYSVQDHETEFPANGGAIDLPADAVGVISVYTEDDYNAGQWIEEHRWRYNPDSTTTGYGLRVGGHYRPGHGIRVVYAQRPALFDLDGALTQDFATVTGLPARCEDLIQLGVAYRLAPFVDLAKLPFLSASAREMGDAKAPGTGAQVARLLFTLFQQRVEQESAVLAKEHPIRLHKTGA